MPRRVDNVLMVVWRDARAQCHYRLANLLLRMHRYESAANSYGRVLGIRPDDPHVHSNARGVCWRSQAADSMELSAFRSC